jgi:hypothetical protein
MKNILLLTTALLIQSCCSNNKHVTDQDLRVIDVAGGVGKSRLTNLSEIADSIEYIPLETTSESIFKPYLFVFYEKDMVYFPQRNGIIQLFDSEGKYIRTFNRSGRGPQEYERMAYIDIDNSSGNICVESFKKILEYTESGLIVKIINFPEEEEFLRHSTFPFKKVGEFYVFENKMTYSAIALDSLSKISVKLNFPQEQLELIKEFKNSLPSMDTYIYKFKDKIRVVTGNNKSILTIDKNLSVDTAFIINYGKYNIANAGSEKITPNSPYLWRKSDFFESNNYLFMQFHVGPLADKPVKMLNADRQEYTYPQSYSVFNKKTGKFIFLDQPEINQLGFVEDIEGGPAVWPKYISADNYLVSFIQAEEFIAHAENHKVSEKFRAIAAKLKETDNPVLVRVKLKND